jgi:hypothetical protein
MTTAVQRPRHLPYDDLGEPFLGNDPTFPQEQPRHAVGVYTNSGARRQTPPRSMEDVVALIDARSVKVTGETLIG